MHSIYEQSDIPAGMTLADYRAKRRRPGRRPRRVRRLLAALHLTRR
jgi:hypothetical protein